MRRWLPVLGVVLAGCTPTSVAHDISWNAREQILSSEASQVKVRAAQSRVFDTQDRRAMLEALVTTFQDLGFQVEVLDEVLGIVSGTKFVVNDDNRIGVDPTYFLYDDESLVVFTRSYRSWGPFWHRIDLVRLTATVRERSETQLIVRASAQCLLRPIEDPEPYQKFFATLEQARFTQRTQ